MFLPHGRLARQRVGAQYVYQAPAAFVLQRVTPTCHQRLTLLLVGSVGVPETSRYDIRLRPGGTIRGTVTDEDGKPVPMAEIRMAMQNSWSPMAAMQGTTPAFAA